MYVAKQFSIFMVNKPGILAQVLGEFAKAKMNIIAMTMVDADEHGVMRVVFGSQEKARDVVTHLSLPFNETDVLCVNLANRVGAFAEVAVKLAKNHINISYAYCTAGAKGGRTIGVLKVADVKKAMHVLKSTKIKQNKSKPVLRKTRAMRR